MEAWGEAKFVQGGHFIHAISLWRLQMSDIVSMTQSEKSIYLNTDRISELQDQLSGTQDQLNQVSSDLTHLHGERSDKYKELKKREETMRG